MSDPQTITSTATFPWSWTGTVLKVDYTGMTERQKTRLAKLLDKLVADAAAEFDKEMAELP